MVTRFGLLVIWLALQLMGNKQTGNQSIVDQCTEAAFDTAINIANDGDTIVFTCSVPITLTSPKVIKKHLTMQANGLRIAFMHQGKEAAFEVASGSVVTLSGFVFEADRQIAVWIVNEGNLRVSKCIFKDGEVAIHNKQGILHIEESLVVNNLHGLSNYGGTLWVERVTFRNNAGTALYNAKKAQVINSVFAGNAHGIDNGGGILFVKGGYFYGNKVQRSSTVGAGIATSGKAYVVDSVFTANEAYAGAGIFNRNNGYLLIRHTRLINNPESNCRGSIWDGGGNVQYPLTTCGKTIQVEPSLNFVQPIWSS